MESSLQELDETQYWLELLDESGIAASSATADVTREADELVRIFDASVKSSKTS